MFSAKDSTVHAVDVQLVRLLGDGRTTLKVDKDKLLQGICWQP